MQWPRSRVFFFVAAVVAGFLVAGLLRLRRPAARAHAATSAEESSESAALAPLAALAALQPTAMIAAAPGASESADQPVIDDARIEKSEVCAGEETFVIVAAHAQDGSDAFLNIHVRVPGSGRFLSGTRVPLRLESPSAEPIRIVVSGKRGSRVVELPPLKVKDCVEPLAVVISVQQGAANMARPHFTAEIVRPTLPDERGEPFEPSVYKWDFGDGHQETTDGAQVEHSYEDRLQNVAYSNFLVTVKVADGRGREVQGSLAQSFANVGFLSLVYKNQVVVSTGVKEVGRPGGVAADKHEEIWLYHGYPETVRFERATLRETVLDEAGKEHETWRREYNPEQLIGFHELKAHESRTVRDLTNLQPSGDDPSAVRFIEVRGHSEDGKEAWAKFTLVAPSKTPTARPPETRPPERGSTP